MLKRIIISVISLVMILPLVACDPMEFIDSMTATGETTTSLTATTKTTTYTTTADPNANKPTVEGGYDGPLEHLHGLNFGGKPVTFALAGAKNDDYHIRSIWVDAESAEGDFVDRAIYERNQRIEKDLGVTIKVIYEENISISQSPIKTLLLGGSTEFDVIAGYQCGDIGLVLKGVMEDLNKLEERGGDYIKWESEYWDSAYTKALDCGTKRFWLAGDLCLRMTAGCHCMFVNSRLYDSILAPEYGSIYDVVKNKEWTYDKLIEMVEKSNGDVKLDPDLECALALPNWDNTNAMATSAGVCLTRYAAGGVPHSYFNSENEALFEFMSKHRELLNTKGVYYPSTDSLSFSDEAVKNFSANKSIFVTGTLDHTQLYLRDMKDPYYVIPHPMLNSEQEGYRTGVYDGINIYGINYSSENVPAAAATLELLAYESYYNVRQVLWEDMVHKDDSSREQTLEMIALIRNSVYTDPVILWQYSPEMDRLGFFLRDNVLADNFKISQGRADKWEAGIVGIFEEINAIK